VLTSAELVEIRAAQRTFEGAYVRTAIGQFSFALVVLKIFTAEFYSIGALFAVYGAGILFISLFRRQQGQLTVMVQMYDDDGGVAADNRQVTNSSSQKSVRMACTGRSSEHPAMLSLC
jgi:hypothetical protein